MCLSCVRVCRKLCCCPVWPAKAVYLHVPRPNHNRTTGNCWRIGLGWNYSQMEITAGEEREERETETQRILAGEVKGGRCLMWLERRVGLDLLVVLLTPYGVFPMSIFNLIITTPSIFRLWCLFTADTKSEIIQKLLELYFVHTILIFLTGPMST